MQHKDIIDQNKQAWDFIADDWFGSTALPTVGVHMANAEVLGLFGDVSEKKVLDIGCGSGHSLKYMADCGAAELWGLDLSEKQIDNASVFLKASGYSPTLFCAPMELNPGLPVAYFDVVYSIYALGWTVDLDATLALIASYLKPNGVFVFSWDHPLMKCVALQADQLVFEGSYHEEDMFSFTKGQQPVSVINRKMSTYINTLAKYGLFVEQLFEEVDAFKLDRPEEFSSAYYAHAKAIKFPLSFVIKARKLAVQNADKY